MEVKSRIIKRRTGKSAGKWIVKIEYFDETKGKKCFLERHAEKKGAATDLKNKLIDEIKKTHGQIQTGERMTFSDLADYCERTFYKPAVIAEGRKVAGVRSHDTAKRQLTTLKKFFGKRLIKQITTQSIEDFKLWRLKTDSEQLGRPVKIATVNRELTTMGKIMRFAYGKGWILKDIFFNAKVVDKSAEMERSRLLTVDEDARLLDSCQGEREITYSRKWRGKEQEITAKISVDNPYLKAIILLALDSALRRGEILKLRWQDIDFENNLILVLGTHTKTERERTAPLSERTKVELENIKSLSPSERIFPFAEFKHSFNTAKKIAKIDDLHFHDLRRTAITRWIQNGTPLPLAGKLAGHTQLQTTLKYYVNNDATSIKEITERMNIFNSEIDNKVRAESKLLN